MLQPDAFCEHTMQQNATAAGAPPLTRWRSLLRSPRPTACFKGAASRRGWGGRREGRGREGGEEKGRIGAGREGKGREGEVDSDAQLEQGRPLAKAGPARFKKKYSANNYTLNRKLSR